MSGLDHGWDKGEEPNHADFIHGGVGVDDFEKEVNYQTRTKKNKARAPRVRGCQGNDNGPHVYVWTTEHVNDWLAFYGGDFYERSGFHRREYKTCCGCGKVANSRYTDEMAKAIAKRGWYRANYG